MMRTTTTLTKIRGLILILTLSGCTAADLKQIGLGDLYFKVGRDNPEHPESRGLLDTAMGSLTLNGKQFTPAEEERAQKALSELLDGEEISWNNPHHGRVRFRIPKEEPGFITSDKNRTSTWQNQEGLTCRSYELLWLFQALWTRASHDACLKNGRWIPGPADRVSTS